ncbi:MAG: DUF1848 domain-containing protein [Schwartzia sp.]|nr:DUF1848 domain-containing protein [Schwartzia sp. (in: firmicutes)]
MILNTGSRTDIPAFYADWFYRRVRAGEVLSRSPYDAARIFRYRLRPDVVDAIVFCTKNPRPMLDRLDALAVFRQVWHITITPYGPDIEPGVPEKEDVMDSLRALSRRLGARAVTWRYDPVFLTEKYPVAFHIAAFERMAAALAGYTEACVISFLDLYVKTRRNFPEGREVAPEDRLRLGQAFAESARRHGMRLYACLEGDDLRPFGVDTSGCLAAPAIERAIGQPLAVPRLSPARRGCACLLGADIGAYNTCAHGCRYCYANYDTRTVAENRRRHDPASPLLIGHLYPGDQIRDARQESWLSPQMSLDLD